jgi:hypothetical protein
MYFFTRTARIRNGQMIPATNWAVELTGRVNTISELRVQLWSSILSPGLGTLAWSTFVPDLMTLETANGKLAADQSFLDDTAQSGDLMVEGSFDDVVLQLVHTAGEPTDDPHYATIVTSAMAAGGIAKGVEVGIEIAGRAAEISGVATSFLVATTGPYGGCAWISGARTFEEIEKGDREVSSNPELIAYLDEHAAGVYRPEVSTQTMWRRLV